jgi:hypothetical protein
MPLNCDNCRDRLLGYLYEELDADERSAVEEALSRCPDCQRELAAMRTVGRAFDSLPRAEFPEKRTLDLIREARLAADARKRPARVALWLGSLATVSALGVIGLVSVLRAAAPEMAQHDQFAVAPASTSAEVAAAAEQPEPAAAVAAAAAPGEEVAEESPEVVATQVVGENGIVVPEVPSAPAPDNLGANVVGGMQRDTVARADDAPAMPTRGAGGTEPEDPAYFERQQQAAFGVQREGGAMGAGDYGGTRGAPGGETSRREADLENEDVVSEVATRNATVTSPVAAAPVEPQSAPPAPRPETTTAASPVDGALAWGSSPTTATTGSVAQGYGGATAQPAQAPAPAPTSVPDDYADRTVAVADEAESSDRRDRRREQERDNASARSSAAPAAEPTMLDGDSSGLAQAGEEIDSAVSASLYDEAQAALAAGLYPSADEYFAAFLELAQAGDRRITGAYLGRARCAAALGRNDSARAFIESMLARSPSDEERRQAAELLERLDAPAQYDDNLQYNRAFESAEPPAP